MAGRHSGARWTKVYGENAAVQRCRNHKARNVLDHLPENQRAHAKLVIKAAFNVEEAGKGAEKLRQYAADLERGGWTSAAGSLREGLDELFTVNALGLPSALRRCLGTTNLLDSAHSGTLREAASRDHLAQRRDGGALGGGGDGGDGKAF